MCGHGADRPGRLRVSMESGLEDRNNDVTHVETWDQVHVSMESGLEDRNNRPDHVAGLAGPIVSMESGLEDRNNRAARIHLACIPARLNGVRPRRPEQSVLRLSWVRTPLLSQWSPA